MVIYRIGNSNSLLIHSAIALDEESMKLLDNLGSVDYLIVPNRFHRADIAVYKQRYPKALILAPSVARSHVEKIVPVDHDCEEFLPRLGIQFEVPPGGGMELVYKIKVHEHDYDGYAFVCADTLFNLPKGNFFTDHIMGNSGFFGVSRIGRIVLWWNKETIATANWFQSLSESCNWEFIIVGHGDVVASRCNFHLSNVAKELKGEL
jgi:hypothetical protein